ncbi:MAG: dTDP-4-dehydrorhamnose reductase [Thermodesulfobacteriota bacterium]|nr:dTDP-4-dehydrorhamnose reductase [Thermodesulfobacteriota bacterium]
MRIMICGGDGQLGRDCKRVFQNKNIVESLDLPILDITDSGSIKRELAKFSPDVVINCAAYTNVDKCEAENDAAFNVNANGPGNLAKICSESGSILIHVSTDYVFDGKKSPPLSYTEADKTAPISVYGKTKLEGEKLVALNTENYMIVRTAWLYGAAGANFLKTMLRLALADPEKEIKVVNDQFGSPTWSLRLALQIEKLVMEKGQGLYHATSEGYCSWYEFASYFLKKMGVKHCVVPCTTEEFPTPALRPGNSILENRRLKREKINSMTGWRHGVDQFVSRYRQELLEEYR